MATGLTEDGRLMKFESRYIKEMIRAMESRDNDTEYRTRI
jgi:hypothetical protein